MRIEKINSEIKNLTLLGHSIELYKNSIEIKDVKAYFSKSKLSESEIIEKLKANEDIKIIEKIAPIVEKKVEVKVEKKVEVKKAEPKKAPVKKDK